MLVVKDHVEEKGGVNICGCQHAQLADPEINLSDRFDVRPKAA